MLAEGLYKLTSSLENIDSLIYIDSPCEKTINKKLSRVVIVE